MPMVKFMVKLKINLKRSSDDVHDCYQEYVSDVQIELIPPDLYSIQSRPAWSLKLWMYKNDVLQKKTPV